MLPAQLDTIRLSVWPIATVFLYEGDIFHKLSLMKLRANSLSLVKFL